MKTNVFVLILHRIQKHLAVSICLIFFISTTVSVNAQWIEKRFPIGHFTAQTQSIFFPSTDLLIFNTTSINSFYTEDQGLTWDTCKVYGNQQAAFSYWDLNEKGQGYGKSNWSGSSLMYTSDSGKSWRVINEFGLNQTIALSSPKPNLVFLSIPGYRGYSGSLTYSLDSAYYQPVGIGTKVIHHLDFYSADLGIFHDGTHIYRTIDTLKTWDTVYTASSGEKLGKIQLMDRNTVYIQKSGGILKSINSGVTWSTITPAFNVVIDMHFLNANYGAVIGSLGVEYTTDGGISWNLVPSFQDQRWYSSTLAFLDSNTIVLGGDFGEYYILDSTYVNSVESSPIVPEIAVYPNPVATDLHLASLTAGNTIKIIGLNGRIVLSVIANANEETLDVSFLDDGYYYLVIESNNSLQQQSFVKH